MGNGRSFLSSIDFGVKIGLVGVGLAILAIVLTILPVPPDQWPKSASSWAAFLRIHRQVLWYIMAAGIGMLVGRGYSSMHRQDNHSPTKFGSEAKLRALAEPKVREALEELLRSGEYDTLIIFGYTCETVWDYIPFELRHNERLKIRVLVRSWMQESRDEHLYNSRVEHLGRRPWQKSEGIRHRALEPWLYKSTCSIRYYSEHPFVKAILILGPNKMSGFISFYRWEEIPEEGGSPFKGSGLSELFIPGDTADEHLILSYLRSQFEMIWHSSRPASELTKEYSQRAPHAPTDHS